MLFLVIVLVIAYFIQNRKNKHIAEYAILTLPVIIYYFIISKTAPYLEQRYILPTIPIIAIGIVLLVSYYINKISKKKYKIWNKHICNLFNCLSASVWYDYKRACLFV